MSRRGFGDLVPMPIPTQWGPDVVPAGVAPNGSAPLDPATIQALIQSGALPPGFTAGALAVPPPGLGPLTPPWATMPGAPWGHQPILPDSMLPPALQRGNPNLRHTIWQPNGYDRLLMRDAARWGWIRAHGGLKGCCRLAELGDPIWDKPPWMVMPSQGEPFQKMFALATGTFVPGVDTVLGQFVVPNGYDGALNRFVCSFTGNGFLDFTGMISWRVLVNNRYARNLGNVQNTYGDFKTAFLVPGTDNIRLVSQQTITLIANIPVGSPVSDGVVAAGAFGWFYPRR